MTSPTKPFILLSFPKDMEYVCDEVRKEFERLLEIDIQEKELMIYSWNIDLDPHEIHHTKPPQTYIPYASHRLCRGVICLFGETLGKPLQYPINKSDLGILPQELEQKPFPTFYPTHELSNTDSFPITGSVFELLTTWKFNEDHNYEKEVAIPLLIVVVGDESVIYSDQPDDFDWGNLQWQTENEERITFNRNRRAFHSWMDQTYYPEIQRLFNFLKYLHHTKGLRPAFEKDAGTAIERIRSFLIDTYGNGKVRGRKPFKGLHFYNENDSDIFFGREKQTQDVLRKFSDLWNDPHYVPFFSIYGGSGVGKSSFLRAGIISRLKKKNHYGTFKTIVILSDELFNVNQPNKNPLGELYTRIITAIIPDYESDDDFESRLHTRNPEDQAISVIQKLLTLIDTKIVIAIDQFEYLIDLRRDDEFHHKLTPLFTFFKQAVATKKIGVIVTSQTNRLESMANDSILGEVWDNGGKKKLSFTQNELEEIIINGFEVSDIPFDQKQIDNILKEFSEFLDSNELNRDSLLPIVSNTLDLLYVKHQENQKTQNKTETSSTDLIKDIDTIDIKDSIDQLAENAITKVKEEPGLWNDEAVKTLLRKLVRIQGKNKEHIILLPSEIGDDKVENKLIKSLKEFRILVAIDSDQEKGRVQFVHEAVVRYWKRAFSWLTSESELLGYRSNASLDAISWEEKERSKGYLSYGGKVNDYTRLLYTWFSYYHRDPENLSKEDLSVKEFIFASISEIEEPFTEVEGDDTKSNHFLLATSYGEFDLVKKYINLDKSVVKSKNSYDSNAVYIAIFSKSIETLELILTHGGNPSEYRDQGWYPIHVASHLGDKVAFDTLLEYKADPLVTNDDNVDILHIVCGNGNLEMLDHILQKNFVLNVNRKQKNNEWTPIQSACYSSSTSVVERLSELPEVDLNLQDKQGWTPLMMACRYAEQKTITALIESKRINYELKTNDGWSALHMACRYQDGFIVSKILEEFSENVNESNSEKLTYWKPIHLAITNKSLTAVQALLKCDHIQHNYTNAHDSLYQKAIDERAYDILELLWNDSKIRESDADHENRKNIFFDAIAKNQLELIRITSKGMDSFESSSKGTILHACVLSNSIDTFELLENEFNFKALINEKDANGNTALHLAMKKGNKELLNILLQKYDPDILVNKEGKTALDAIFNGERGVELLQFLKKMRPAWIFHLDQKQRNLLQVAIEKKELEIVEFLLQENVSLAHKDGLGQNALHFLVKTNSDPLATLVKKYLDNPELIVSPDNNGMTPLHLCCHFGHIDVLKALPFQDHYFQIKGIHPTHTPIELAGETGQREIVNYLLEDKGIDFVRNSTNQPLLKVILLNHHFEWASILLDNYPSLGKDLKEKTDLQDSLIHDLALENKKNPSPIYEEIGIKIWGEGMFQKSDVLQETEQKKLNYKAIDIKKTHQKNDPFQFTSFDEYVKEKSKILIQKAKLEHHNTCQYCGFISVKYMEVHVEERRFYDAKAYTTACHFCAQNFYIDLIEDRRSGVLIWLPEVPPERLSHIMREIYNCRIMNNELPEPKMAREALEFLMGRKNVAKEKIGTFSPAEINESHIHTEIFQKNIRLMPLDRKIIRERDLVFNQFPQILAYWRSKNGPYAGGKNRKFLWLENFYNEYKSY